MDGGVGVPLTAGKDLEAQEGVVFANDVIHR